VTLAIVVVAHGSRAGAANDAHRDTVAALDGRVDASVTAGFLELAEPDIPTAIADAVAAGADDVAVLPFFLYPGRHLVEDIPALVAEAGDRHAGARIRMLAGFGSDPAVMDVLVAQVRAAALDGSG
jgi:sirohydrochlorin ferrochelatase